jgi:hypothetical protein
MNDRPQPRPEPAPSTYPLLEKCRQLQERSRALREESRRLRANFLEVFERAVLPFVRPTPSR